MSAHEDFCGCGEYDCRRCFNADERPEHSTGNAWLDEALAASPSEETDCACDGVGMCAEHVHKMVEAHPMESPSADDVEAVAMFLDSLRGKAVTKGTGVMLSWEDAQGFALVLHAAANRLRASLAASPSEETLHAAASDLRHIASGGTCAPETLRAHADALLASAAPSKEIGGPDIWVLLEAAYRERQSGKFGRWPAQIAVENAIKTLMTEREQAADNFDMMTEKWGQAEAEGAREAKRLREFVQRLAADPCARFPFKEHCGECTPCCARASLRATPPETETEP
jgi:hypothetical protein